jgi:hypothetical protein
VYIKKKTLGHTKSNIKDTVLKTESTGTLNMQLAKSLFTRACCFIRDGGRDLRVIHINSDANSVEK